jgi:hypothetical protein
MSVRRLPDVSRHFGTAVWRATRAAFLSGREGGGRHHRAIAPAAGTWLDTRLCSMHCVLEDLE